MKTTDADDDEGVTSRAQTANVINFRGSVVLFMARNNKYSELNTTKTLSNELKRSTK